MVCLNKLKEKYVFLILFFYGLFIRLPFFFRDYIDRDESSFILMGQSWVDGHLPFTELWDVKPPLTFLFFAIIIYIFGKSFIAIRLAGVLLVTITSFFTYELAKTQTPKNYALITALLCTILQSLFGSLQGVMSEHIAMALLAPAFLFAVKDGDKIYTWLVIGFLVGMALMVKLNLAYVALFLGIAILFFEYKADAKLRSIIKPFLYGIGILVIIGLCILPYYMEGTTVLWWRSVIEAPLAYAGARTYASYKLLFYILPFTLLLWLGWKKGLFNLKNRAIIYLLVATLGTIFAFIKSGRVNGHYLILIYPIILPLAAAIVYNYKSSKTTKLGSAVLIGLLLLIPLESYNEYYQVIRHKIEHGTFYNGEGITVPQYFEKENLDKDKIYFAEYHIGYWLMNIKPITKAATQPSNVLKDEMFFAYDNPRKTGSEELKHIMETIRPNYIITRKSRRVFDKKSLAANFYINLELLKNYVPLDTVDNAIIHQRLKLK